MHDTHDTPRKLLAFYLSIFGKKEKEEILRKLAKTIFKRMQVCTETLGSRSQR